MLPHQDRLVGRTGFVAKPLDGYEEIVPERPNRVRLRLFTDSPATNTYVEIRLGSDQIFRTTVPKTGTVDFSWRDDGPLVTAQYLLPGDGTAGSVYYYECYYR